jgi:RNA polymerase sigma-70 factor (ECF subfamily)
VSSFQLSRQQLRQAPSDISDEQLACLLSEKDDSAFTELVVRYRARLYTYLYRCGVGRSDRYTLFLRIFARASNAAHSLQEGDSLRLWLFTIVARAVAAHLSRPRFETPSLLRRMVSKRPVTEIVVEERSCLEQAIIELPPVKRQIVLLSSCAKLSVNEVAQALQLPSKRVTRLLNQARVALAIAVANDQRCAAS